MRLSRYVHCTPRRDLTFYERMWASCATKLAVFVRNPYYRCMETLVYYRCLPPKGWRCTSNSPCSVYGGCQSLMPRDSCMVKQLMLEEWTVNTGLYEMRRNNLNHQQEHSFGLGSKLFVWRRSGNRVSTVEIMANILGGSVASVLYSRSRLVSEI